MEDNYLRRAEITRIIDGKTIEATIDLGFGMSTTREFLLLYVEEPNEHAISYMKQRILHKPVLIRSVKSTVKDVYFAEVYFSFAHDPAGRIFSISDLMVADGIAKRSE